MGNGPGKLSSNKMINIFPRASEMRELSGLPKGQAGIQVFFKPWFGHKLQLLL